jgi:hypothetical protein
MVGKCTRDEFLARGRQVDHPRAAVVRIIAPLHEALALQAVDRGGDRAARQAHQGSDGIDGRRTFVKKDLQRGEVRESDPQPVNVAFRMPPQAFVRLHENQPEMYAAPVHL